MAAASIQNERDAEKASHKLFRIFGLSLKVPISYIRLELKGEVLKIPFLKPSNYLSKLLKCHSQLVWSNAVDPVRRCQSFWKAYFQSHPGHAVYQQHDLNGLGYVIPVLLHGDEGTGSKKQPVSIVSWMTPWGQPGQAAGRVDKPEHFLKCVACASKGSKVSKCCRIPHEAWPKPNDDRMQLEEADFKSLQEQFPAVSGSSYLSHHLVCVLPTHLVKKGPQVLDAVLEETARDLQVLFTQGVQIGAQRYFAAFLGSKGDAKWHASTGRLLRCYSRLADIRNQPMCAECLGGDAMFPFEDTSDDAAWVETLYESVPWNPENAGPLEAISYDDRAPAAKYRRDLLHIYKIGLGRDVAGSTILLLARYFRHFDSSEDSIALQARLKRAHARFSMFCLADGRCPHLRGFTKESMHMATIRSYPYMNTKGSDTMHVMAWLRLECSVALEKNGQHHRRDLLEVAKQVCSSSIEMFRICYSHGLFLPRPCMVALRDEFLRAPWPYRINCFHSFGNHDML